MIKKSKVFTRLFFFLGLFLLALSAGYFFTIYKRIVVKNDAQVETTPFPTPTPDPLRIRNILLLGYAGGDHDGATLTDTIILARIYPKDQITFYPFS